MGLRNKKKPLERVKSRKELRKDKRLQKKQNRVHFQKRKKELKIEYKEKMKQKSADKKGKANGKLSSKEKQPPQDNDIEEDSTNEHFDDDEEIESDFELSDEELEMKTKSMSKKRCLLLHLKKKQNNEMFIYLNHILNFQQTGSDAISNSTRTRSPAPEKGGTIITQRHGQEAYKTIEDGQ